MKHLLGLLLALLLVCNSTSAFADEAAFGLDWGMSKQEIEKLGVKFDAFSTDYNISAGSTKSLPKNLSIAEDYFVYFVEGKGLQKIVMNGKEIRDDTYGINGKKQFANLKEALIKKYGKPDPRVSGEVTGLRIYKNPDEFYQCLNSDICGQWQVGFTHNGSFIFLELKGSFRGRGQIKMHYEGPSWGAGLDDKQAFENETNNEAL